MVTHGHSLSWYNNACKRQWTLTAIISLNIDYLINCHLFGAKPMNANVPLSYEACTINSAKIPKPFCSEHSYFPIGRWYELMEYLQGGHETEEKIHITLNRLDCLASRENTRHVSEHRPQRHTYHWRRMTGHACNCNVSWIDCISAQQENITYVFYFAFSVH